jgi:malonate transporter and related proteins
MAQASRKAMLDQAQLALVLLAAMLVAYAVTHAVQRIWYGHDRRESALIALTASGPNVGSAGLPIVAALFSKSASISVAVAVAVAAIVVTPISLLLLESGDGKGANVLSVMKKALLQPIVLAPVLGLICSLAGFAPPPAGREHAGAGGAGRVGNGAVSHRPRAVGTAGQAFRKRSR